MKAITYLNKLSCLLILFITLEATSQNPLGGGVTTGESPCDSIRLDPNDVYQTSTFGVNHPSFAIDGYKTSTFSKTMEENEPYWEADLGGIRSVKGVRITWPSLPDSNYYIIFSKEKLETRGLLSSIQSPVVKYLHIASPFGNNEFYTLDSIQARYVRIQLNRFGSLALGDVGINGKKEICNNGIDDDCDGLVDCDDVYDCGCFISEAETKIKDPSCSVCLDGSIYVYGVAYGCNNCTAFSIDGGLTWSSNNFFTGLGVGTYNIQVKNTNSGCITSFPKTVYLRGINNDSLSNCLNGSFEEGNFSHWKTYMGSNVYGVTPNPQSGFDSERFAILSQINDEYSDYNITLENDCNGKYVARVGNSLKGAQLDRLEYKFKVDNTNTDFSFRYAFVLEEHTFEIGEPIDNNRQPYFKYYVHNITKNINIVDEPYYAIKTDPRLKVRKNKAGYNYFYKTWECYHKNLSEWIGDSILVYFEAADCTETGHFGYGYVDGLCSNVKPKAILDIKPIFCESDSILAIGKRSFCESDYTLTLCEVSNGTEINCVSKNFIGSFNQPVDLKLLYSQSGKMLVPEKQYRVKLHVFDACSDGNTDIKDFTIQKISDMQFKNMLICQNAQDLQIQTTGNPTGFSFSWSPANLFQNPTIPNPKLKANIPFGDYLTTVSITKNGCTENRNVRIIIMNPELIKVTQKDSCLGYCETRISVELKFPFKLDATDLQLRWLPLKYPGRNFSTLNNLDSSTLTSSWSFRKNRTGKIALFLMLPNSISFGCDTLKNIYLPEDTLYFGQVKVYIPNIFSPASTNPNNQKLIIFCPNTGYNAFWYKFEVFERSGGRIISSSDSAIICGQPFAANSINWDGLIKCTTSNGSLGTKWCNPSQVPGCVDEPISFPSAVYTYYVDFANCDHPINTPVHFEGDATLADPVGQNCTNSCKDCR